MIIGIAERRRIRQMVFLGNFDIPSLVRTNKAVCSHEVCYHDYQRGLEPPASHPLSSEMIIVNRIEVEHPIPTPTQTSPCPI